MDQDDVTAANIILLLKEALSDPRENSGHDLSLCGPRH